MFRQGIFFMLPCIADADIGSLKSLHTFWDKYTFVPHPGEIWTKSYGLNYTNFWTIWQKLVNHFWLSVDAILEDFSVAKSIVRHV